MSLGGAVMAEYLSSSKRKAGRGLLYREVDGDIFASKGSASLVLYVSEDLHMSLGIAEAFKEKYGGVDDLREQG